MKWFFAIVITALLLGAEPVAAGTDGFSCDDKIVQVGDYLVTVLERCGEPDLRERYATGNDPRDCIFEEQWVYRRGYGQFRIILIFRNGRLESIERGDRE